MSSMRVATSIAALGIVAAHFSAAACGRSSAPQRSNASQPPARSAEPCSLLTKEDAEATLGTPVRESPAAAMTPTCQYLGQRGQSVTLQLHAGAGPSFDAYVAQADSSFQTQSHPVAALGDKAAFNGTQLIVRKGADLVVLTVGANLPPDEKLEKARALALKVLGRM